MLQEKEQQSAQSNLYDSDSVYGWISILLHWATAVVIIILWFIGKSIMNAPAEDVMRNGNCTYRLRQVPGF